MIIRNMTINDYEKVYTLWINTSGMGLNDIDDSKKCIAKYLTRNPSTCFVADDDGEIKGVIMCGHDGRRGFIYHTAVAKDSRGTGIGRALVNHALDALKSEGIIKACLVAFTKNEPGNAFWEKLGFKVREDLYYRDMRL